MSLIYNRLKTIKNVERKRSVLGSPTFLRVEVNKLSLDLDRGRLDATLPGGRPPVDEASGVLYSINTVCQPGGIRWIEHSIQY